MLSGAGIRVATKEVVVQHLQIRPGDIKEGMDPSRRDGLAVGGNSSTNPSYNIVLDHLSVSWGIDENASTWDPQTHDVTFSNCIIAEGLKNSIHPKGAHSMGLLIGSYSTDISIFNNLLAHNQDRNTYFQPGVTAEYLNNVVYDWGSAWSNMTNLSDYNKLGVPVLLNFVGNYYKAGAASAKKGVIAGTSLVNSTRIYALANIGPTRLSDSGDQWLISALPTSPYRTTSPAIPSSGITARTPTAAFDHVLANVGSRPKQRSVVDTRIISEVRNGTGDLKDCVAGCTRNAGGWPTIDQNRRVLTIPSNPNGDDNGDGYTNLENWLHGYLAQVQ